MGCLTKVSPGKDQKSSTPVGQSNHKKTCAMVAKSHQEGEETLCVCECLERPRLSGNSKSSLNGLARNNEATYSAACRAQSNDGKIYIEVDKLNGWPVKVLRDTGCTQMNVDRALIPNSMVIPGSWQMVDCTLIDVSVAIAYLITKDIAK